MTETQDSLARASRESTSHTELARDRGGGPGQH